jgi:hypothetical protein
MNWIVRFLFVALLSFTAGSADAYADCGNCGDAGHADTEKGDHSHGEKTEKTAECSCKSAKDGASYWCGHCGVGHHEGKKIKCEGCYKKATGESKEDCSSCTKKKGSDAAEKGSECEG